MKRTAYFVLILACGLVACGSNTTPATTSATTHPTTATVVTTTTAPVTTTTQAVVPVTVAPLLTAEAVDGDTITMSNGDKVRLIGIDTPERGECGYKESSSALEQFIVGHDITLVSGARDDTDKYGRLLRYVEVDGVDVNLRMIESGHAIARYDGRDGYGVHPRQDAYVAADDASPSTNECVAAVVTTVPPTIMPTITAPNTTTEPAPASVYYKNCTEARAAGAAPLHVGDPGWRSKLDRDGDGIACE